MKTIRVEVPGDPVAQGRPRFARRGKFVSTYDPPKSRAYKQEVAIYARASMASRKPFTGPIKVTVYIFTGEYNQTAHTALNKPN